MQLCREAEHQPQQLNHRHADAEVVTYTLDVPTPADGSTTVDLDTLAVHLRMTGAPVAADSTVTVQLYKVMPECDPTQNPEIQGTSTGCERRLTLLQKHPLPAGGTALDMVLSSAFATEYSTGRISGGHPRAPG